MFEEKQKKLISLANKGKYFESLADEIEQLHEKRQTLLVGDVSLSGESERINELMEFISTNKYRTLLYNDRFVICFKSGIEIKI